MIEEQLAGRCFAVASGAPRFLVIRLDAARHVEVHHEPDVRAIDPHSECVRRHHDVAPALHELVLRLFALLIVHPAVVKNARNLRELQRFGDSLDPLPRRAINDAGLVLADQRIQAFVFLRLVRDVRDEQLQIGPRESRHEFPRLAQTKMRQDIAAHFRCGRRGEGRHLGTAQYFQNLIEPEIIGAKIVAPHRETMRFVDREKRDRALAERFQKRPTPETFRRDVDELEFASRQCADALALFFGRDRAVYQRGRNAAALERVDLVFHERDQRRDDDGGAFE